MTFRRDLTRFSFMAALIAVVVLGLGAPAMADTPPDSSATGAAAPDTATAKSEAKSEAKTKAKSEAKTKAKGRKKSSKAVGKGVAKKVADGAQGAGAAQAAVEPQHVQVQHILIGFAGTVPGKNITRTREEAAKLAQEILERAKKGEDFNTLVQRYTDDSPPGIYGMSNRGVAPAQGEYARDGMVPAFGNVGFVIGVGEFGLAEYNPQASPFGWHIIRRIK
jgi:hypothetical protein